MTFPIVIDDVIPLLYQDEVEKLLLEKQPWYYQSDINFSDEHLKELDKTGSTVTRRPGFGSLLFDLEKSFGTPNNLLTPILYSAISNTDIVFNQILQARGFMSMPVSKDTVDKIDKPHVDGYHHHMVCIYYVNDSDGDTVIFNKRSGNYVFDTQLKGLDPKELPILETITPKKGRCVIFNGNFFHASTQPTSGVRCVLNFNFI